MTTQLDKQTNVLAKKRHFHQVAHSFVHHNVTSRYDEYGGKTGKGDMLMHKEEYATLTIGYNMEQTAEAIKLVNAEIEESKKTLGDLYNQVTALHEMIMPALNQQIKDIRDARMATVMEVRDTLSALKDIRKFFLEDSHVKEVDRLKDLIRVCHELEKLKHNGTLDAICDSVIRLAVQERQP